MYFTFLRRELLGRRRQTLIIAVGMAIAIALVIVVNSFTAGVQNAQAKVLESVYGVGTDMTVTQTPTLPTGDGAGPQQFGFGRGDGQFAGGTQSVSQSRLSTRRGPDSATMPSTNLKTVLGTTGVKAAAGTLVLENTTFSGQLPDAQQSLLPGQPGQPGQQGQTQLNRGGTDGQGGSAFSIETFSVIGIDPTAEPVGPLASVVLSNGVALSASDVGKYVAVVDDAYATTKSLTVGSDLTIGGSTFTVVGIVTNASTAGAATAANVYIPLDVAQTLSANAGLLSTIYVQASSSSDIPTVQTALQKSLTDTTVKTQADLAASVSGSLSIASSLLDGLGLWLAIIVLATAFLIAILFTISGVTRRTREFGTLKAIGWSNARITSQVAGESFITSALGGLIGIVLGIVGIVVINLISPTLDGSTSRGFRAGGFGGGTPSDVAAQLGQSAGQMTRQGGFGGGQNPFAAASQTVVLHAPFSLTIMLIALGLALVGGILAGALGGWRASRLSPAAALRSVN